MFCYGKRSAFEYISSYNVCNRYSSRDLGWWLENGGSFQDSKKDDDIKDNDIEETEGKSKDEEN